MAADIIYNFIIITLLHNFHNMRVTWLFCHFFKLQVHILNSLENINSQVCYGKGLSLCLLNMQKILKMG